uniref:Secreted protein n=1 Tax=Arundo donax TaxID=35708 RepID=A0A0A9FGJ3_ARUDO
MHFCTRIIIILFIIFSKKISRTWYCWVCNSWVHNVVHFDMPTYIPHALASNDLWFLCVITCFNAKE